MTASTTPLFSLGQLVATPLALEAMASADVKLPGFMARYVACDWGVVDEDDKRVNDDAVVSGGRIVAVYLLPNSDATVYVVTDADRSTTTIMLACEY